MKTAATTSFSTLLWLWKKCVYLVYKIAWYFIRRISYRQQLTSTFTHTKQADKNLHYCINILTFNMCTATKSIPNLSTKSKVGLLSNKVERASTVVMIRFFKNQLAAIANFICNSLNKTQSRLEFSVDSLYDSRFQPRQSNKLKKSNLGLLI